MSNGGPGYDDRNFVECNIPEEPFLSIGHATSTNSVIEGECVIGVPHPSPLPESCGLVPMGTWTSTGGNVESPGDSCQFTDPTDQVNASAAELGLGPLQDNGGSYNFV